MDYVPITHLRGLHSHWGLSQENESITETNQY